MGRGDRGRSIPPSFFSSAARVYVKKTMIECGERGKMVGRGEGDRDGYVKFMTIKDLKCFYHKYTKR